MSIDQQAVVQAYQADRVTIPALAARFDLKPADVAAILRLNGVAIRKGNVMGANNLTPEARAKGQAIRANKAMVRVLTNLVARHGFLPVWDALTEVGNNMAPADDVAAQ